MKPDQREIDDQLNRAEEAEEFGRTSWPGMTYEQGVSAAIRWMQGRTDERPMDE
jgi:hypothetical protein